MTNKELFELLYNLEPESKKQAKLISDLLSKIYLTENTHNSITEYLAPVMFDEILNKPVSKIYAHYMRWCSKQGYDPEHINTFTKVVHETFNVYTKVIKINGKSVRVYKSY